MVTLNLPTDDELQKMSLQQMRALISRLIAALKQDRDTDAQRKLRFQLIRCRNYYYFAWSPAVVGAGLFFMGVYFSIQGQSFEWIPMLLGIFGAAGVFPALLAYRWELRKELQRSFQKARQHSL